MKRLLSIMVFFPLIVFLFVFAGCKSSDPAGNGKEPELFIVATWNVQNLFDGHESGREYRDFREGAGWTAEKYQARINSISQAIIQMSKPVPALIGFTEIENAGVLEDLARGALSRYGYNWIAFANIPGAPVGIGFLSRFPLDGVRAHSITIEGQTAPRPLLEARVEPGGKPLVFLLSHWKSKRGGDIATTPQRRASARVAQRRLGELKGAEPETPVIIMGDLNENHDEFYRHLGKVLSALLPDDSDAASLAGNSTDFLVLSSEKPPRASYFPEGVHALYSPWGREKSGGSYYFRDRWETIDHVLLSAALFDGSGWEFADSQVLSHAPFTAADGSPNTYSPRSGRGLSDHLPLLLFLRDFGGD